MPPPELRSQGMSAPSIHGAVGFGVWAEFLAKRSPNRRRRIDRSGDPHPAAGRKLDLDHAGFLGGRWRRRRFRLWRDCDRIKRRRYLGPLTKLLAPAK